MGCTVGSSFLVQYVHGRRYGEGQGNCLQGIVTGVHIVRFEQRNDSNNIHFMCTSNHVRRKNTYHPALLYTHPCCRVDSHLLRSIEKTRESQFISISRESVKTCRSALFAIYATGARYHHLYLLNINLFPQICVHINRAMSRLKASV